MTSRRTPAQSRGWIDDLNRFARLGFGIVALTAAVSLPSRAAPIDVAVTLEPEAFFVERVGGAAVRVQVLVGPGQCAETYEPTPKQMARLSASRVYFAIGMPMEETLLPRLRANQPTLTVVDIRAGIPIRQFERDLLGPAEGGDAEEAAGDHGRDDSRDHEDRQDLHGHQGHHDHLHAGEDPHVWLNPHHAKVMTTNVAAALARIDPAHAAEYQSRAHALLAELDTLDAEVATLLAPVRGRDLLVYHPFYGYLADAYGLRQVPIEVGGFKPGSKYLTRVVERAQRDGGKAVFGQEGAATASAETVAREIGASVVLLDPMSRDYVANLRLMAAKIRDGILGK
jgi:zinc transport system substrate-binding protein